MNPEYSEIIDLLSYEIHENRISAGQAAADYVETKIKSLLELKDEIRIVFAAAPSQDEMLECLITKQIEWSRITAFHMDEYLGLPDKAVQLFSNYLNVHLFSLVEFGQVHLIDTENWESYGAKLTEKPIDLICMGIGENGHIAFNDPPVADFQDTKIIKRVTLDKQCRQQQVHDGCFPSLEQVPEFAVTLTIPALMSAGNLSIVVPGQSKAKAVFETINGEISVGCPATILRTHKNARMFLDRDSAALLK